MFICEEKSAQIDKKWLHKAANAINQLRSKEAKIKIVLISRVKDEVADSFFWYFADRYEHHRVKIDGITNQVSEVDTLKIDWTSDEDFAKSFAKPKYTQKQAISAASGKVMSIFNVNLAGYKVSVKWNEYTFKKDKQPVIVGKINKKGEFYYFSLTP
ncbi:hypothetical protein M5X00_07300 [Paenibacillus alvei]|uniref:Uncharacterized protein n=1 Tax=Paenibacillus alvei TaxID=44250 RepID=A0ABT4GW34_PAEAL|nr:hypothetical protein [Paenibacillus alvei]EJW15223.1 hypothetical protein PAV_9c01480 [Paenibacillus alvei DSM 29]MCY9544270.1 hypothetical protein [Paenibacillus alvei]MCY9702878.1 hypothetical protein [Paenibacillus alvei]MCY9733193.1 hypothetical protein [Paenibacillus alvei]MCY9754058.1 hypothetical protein [Paenibacillus alvei]